jgi:hypothetical protein
MSLLYLTEKKSAMKKISFLIIVLLKITLLSGQSYTLQGAYEFYKMQKLREDGLTPVLTESEIQGSPYASKDFQEGFMVTVQNQKFVGISLRYNIYNDRIEYRDDKGNPMVFTYPEIINHVMIGDTKYIYSPYSVVKKIEKGFFRVIEEGKVSLYDRQNVMFQEAQAPGAYKDAVPPQFIKKPVEYYIRVEPGEAKKVGSKNELPSLFPDKQAELEEYIKKNKVKPNNEGDLKNLVKFYNSLN